MSSPEPLMTPYYLNSEPHASISLRKLANGLNETAYQSFCFPAIHSPPHIGFDLEWRPTYISGAAENPIAVIQIAYQTVSYVIHVRWMNVLPDGLVEILENPRIVKVGVGIQNDAKKLWKDLGIHLNTVVDLSLFVKCVDSGLFAERLDRYADVPLPPESAVIPDPSSQSLPQTTDFPEEHYKSEAFLGPHIHRLFRGPYSAPVGLARLTEMYTGIVLTKGKITRSNWEAVLTQAQLTYAALDAYAGYIVYAHLVKLFNLLEPTQRPRRRFYAFDCIRGTLYHCCGDSMRTLPGELMDDSDHPRSDHGDSFPTVFYSVGDEIAMHLQGIGTDQPFGLVPWTESNPEYNPGPMRPRKTPEEKEAARIARQKRRTGNQAEEREGQSVGAHSNAETKGPQNGKESAPHSKVSRPPIHPPSQSNRPPPRPTKSLGPNTSRPTAPNFAKQTAFRPSATKSDMNGITTAMKIDRPPEVQSKATVAQTALSLGPSQNNTKDRQTNRRVRSKRNSPLKAT